MVFKENIKIGGEFEINPSNLKGGNNSSITNNFFLFSTGRAAFWYALIKMNNDNNFIHLPYFICESVINTCLNANKIIKFYELDEDWLIPLEYLDQINTNEILLSVNYFGIINDNYRVVEIKQLRKDIIIISDHVQSFWTCKDSHADFAFTGLRKHFSIPEGGLLYKNKKLVLFDESIVQNKFYIDKLLGAILKYENSDDSLYLNLFSSGEHLLDCQSEVTKASLISTKLFLNYNFDSVAEIRKKNYKYLYDEGTKVGLKFVFPYNREAIALVVPILLENRDLVRKKLASLNIYLPVHWMRHNFSKMSKIAKNMEEKSISLVIDQRYTFKDIDYIIENLR